MGYSNFLDLGVSRAITKFLPECLALGRRKEAYESIWNALLVNFVFGVLGGVFLFTLASPFVRIFRQISEELREEAIFTLQVVSIGFPVFVMQNTLRGTLAALQRFDLINLFDGVIGTIQWFSVLMLVWSGFGLRQIALFIVIFRFASFLLYAGSSYKLFPNLVRSIKFTPSIFLKLLSFGGWVTISAIIQPVFNSLGEMIIGSMISIAAVTYYSIPYRIVTRLLIVPMSLTATLLPFFSEQNALGEKYLLNESYFRSIKMILLVMAPLSIFLAAFADNILEMWIGEDFARESSVVLRILSGAIFINSLAGVAYTLLHALGRPDLTAKFHLIELLIYILLCIILIPSFKITGAALAWGGLIALDALLLFWAASRRVGLPTWNLTLSFIKNLILAGSLSLIIFLTQLLSNINFALKGLLFIVTFGFYTCGVWLYGMDNVEKSLLTNFRNQILRRRK
jgi:O-antigen/teichoic acid export membrane protein